MNLTQLILLTLKTSIVLSVFALGLRADHQHATYLFRRPKMLFRALLSMDIVLPLIAVALVLTFHLHPAVKIALVALSVSPVPPVLPKKALKAGGREDYTIGLLVAAAVMAIVVIPVALELFQKVFAAPLQMSPGSVARLVVTTILAPLAIGIGIRAVAPAFGERASALLARVATVLLVVSVVPVLLISAPAILSLVGDGTLIVLTAFSLMGLVVGHLLGGPDSEDRTVLALSTSSRHPGVAMAIAYGNFPEQKLALAAIFLALIVNAVVSALYIARTKDRGADAEADRDHRAA